MPSDTTRDKHSNLIDRLSRATGRVTAWLTLFMVITTFVIVVMRYAFDVGLIWMQESVTWMHAVVFMVGAAYTLGREDHVRVDIFYREMNARRRAWVDVLGVLILLLPMCGLLGVKAWDFVALSWSLKEASRESGGLPYPLLPILKTVLLLMPAAVALQGVSLALHSVKTLKGP